MPEPIGRPGRCPAGELEAPAASSRRRCPRFTDPRSSGALNKLVHSEPASNRPRTSGGRKNHGTPRNNYDRQSMLRSQPKTLRPRPRAGGGRAERGRDGLAEPCSSRSDAAVEASEAGLRPPTRPHLGAEQRRLGAHPRRPSLQRRAGSGARHEGATPDAREGAPCAPLQPERVDLGALARRPHDVRRPHGRLAAPLSGRRPEGARQGLRLGKAVPVEADPEGPPDLDLSRRTF